jgi:PAS domain S-box-containing protein
MMPAALKLSDNQFVQLLLDSIGDGVFALDQEGNITLWNPSMERISGYRADEVLGKNCRLLHFDNCFGRECPADFSECRIFQEGQVLPTECSLRHKEGRVVPVIKSARVIRDQKQTVLGVVETVTDLTELKRAKWKLEETARRWHQDRRQVDIIGNSPAIQRTFSAISAAASSETTVLIQGESGTGKEIVAGAIHYNSRRHDKPLITVNCSALPESLLESELFGHVKGAFTGAIHDRMGRFEEAHGGTVFLDEIGEISPLIQIKLLRVLQERQIQRVGESRTRKIDIRIIGATNKDLYELVQTEHYREDLYYRLKVFPITLPPLRNRKEDIPLLVSYFIKMLGSKTGRRIETISASAMRVFMKYHWPGNVRELENAIEHAFVICTGDQIGLNDLPEEILNPRSHRPTSGQLEIRHPEKVDRRKMTRETLLCLLQDSEWNKAEVSRRTGLSRATIWKYMKKWDIPSQ